MSHVSVYPHLAIGLILLATNGMLVASEVWGVERRFAPFLNVTLLFAALNGLVFAAWLRWTLTHATSSQNGPALSVVDTKTTELLGLLDVLKKSRDKVRKQNRHLQILAARDSLTGCLNRRALFDAFDRAWESGQLEHRTVSCIMVDVDHFKMVNDVHGHAVGDTVLAGIASALRKAVQHDGVVGRYGGEEFCVLLPDAELKNAAALAETCRCAVAGMAFGKLRVTASFGVASSHFGADSPHAAMDQADRCLFAAKHRGRNRVVSWEDLAVDTGEAAEPATPRRAIGAARRAARSLPQHAVSALLSALAYRDHDTAAHSTRVADLCVATARGLMTVADIYVLETAALLHDIGKIGVPDSILLKPSGLSPDEYRIMRMHDRIGVEIVAASFRDELLVEIMRRHHLRYAGDPSAPHAPKGDDIPLGARIVSIADAYDSMVSDRVYRKGRSREQAFAELRRCAGDQFDPNLVERFIDVVSARRDTTSDHPTNYSKELALRLGIQTEHLVHAVSDHDLAAVASLAKRLEASATRYGTADIARIARDLHNVADHTGDLAQVVNLVHELVDLCACAQKAYATVDGDLAIARQQSLV